MKLLFVTPNLPRPWRTGSATTAYYDIKYLAKRHTVDLISFRDKSDTDLRELADWCNDVKLVYEPPRWQVLLKMGWGVLADLPFGASHYLSPKTADMISRQLACGSYDAALFQLTYMAQFRPSHYQGVSILIIEDPLVLKYRRQPPWGMAPHMQWLTQYEIARLTRYEQRNAAPFDRVLLLSKADVDGCQKILPGVKFDWVPYGVDVDFFCPSDAVQRREGMILLSGNMDHPANVEAVEYFCRQVFPLVLKQVPSANLWLIGANPIEAVTRWAVDNRIMVTGFVADIRHYLRQAMVSVCPVHLSFGSRTKILEAMACGTPVVTTSAANTGIGAVSGEHLYIADTPEAFAERVAILLNQEHWAKLAQNGRRFVVDNLAWDKSVAKLEKIIAQVQKESAAMTGK